MAITVADIETLMNLATDSVEAGQYDQAINRATQAQGKLALIASGRQKGQMEIETQWNHSAINDFIRNVEKLRARAGGGANAPFAMFGYQFQTRGGTDEC